MKIKKQSDYKPGFVRTIQRKGCVPHFVVRACHLSTP